MDQMKNKKALTDTMIASKLIKAKKKRVPEKTTQQTTREPKRDQRNPREPKKSFSTIKTINKLVI